MYLERCLFWSPTIAQQFYVQPKIREYFWHSTLPFWRFSFEVTSHCNKRLPVCWSFEHILSHLVSKRDFYNDFGIFGCTNMLAVRRKLCRVVSNINFLSDLFQQLQTFTFKTWKIELQYRIKQRSWTNLTQDIIVYESGEGDLNLVWSGCKLR